MEVVKAAVKLGLGAQRKVAVTAAQKSHSYSQLLASAWQISNILQADHFSPPSGGESSKDGCSETRSEVVSQLVKTVKRTSNLDGARIGIIAKPSAEFVAGIWATWISGAVAVPLALSYPETELLHVMNDADVSVVMGTEEYQELLEGIAQKCSARFYLLPLVPNLPLNFGASEASKTREVEDEILGTLFEEMLSEVGKLVSKEGDEPALIIYTSGTTGKPKGVVHTHRGMGAQVDFMPKFSVRGIWQRWCESYPIDGSKAENAITVFTGAIEAEHQ